MRHRVGDRFQGVPLPARSRSSSGWRRTDAGEPIVVADPSSPAAVALVALAERVHAQAGARGMSLPVINQ